MHQDKKVGLALALLVLGFVGAFCLRQDRNTTVEIPELNDPNVLDEQIADKDRTPYLGTQGNDKLGTQFGSEQELIGITDNQSLSSGSKISAPTISHQNPISNKNKNGTKADRWGEMPEFLKDIKLPNEQFKNSELNDSAFEPNQNHSESQLDQIQTNSDNVKPEHNNAWEVNPVKRTPVNTNPVQSNSAQVRIHTVRSGETLSEISIRYLGTSRKYQEIFKLNRDQLRSPNDIREGMKLRIPVYQSPETVPQSANRQSSVGVSGNAGKRTVGQMVSQPTLKSGSSAVQFEGLIESLSNSKDQKSLNGQDHKKTIQQLEKTLNSSKLLNGKKETNPLPENYRKFIPIPRSPLTPQEYSQNKNTISGQSLSQQQPENLEQIVEDLFDGNPGEAKQSKNRGQAKTYTIKSGDSLESIAVRLYGKRSAAFKIYQKNRDTLKNANYIRPGMVLQLP
ncbi:LysM peptidoglycan-binding domain-containing protein [uncultured Gimesia sp.]|uniref:LysM peptidoglycan-binding domain-containing protein n=1 Tax=uncultured Gimesia sp. TaxID=1678688 RepID=UPI002635D7BD|nr:LysM peptidoglycan-binding domain-containing protein [uncultured Gimesia sp.]